MAVKPLSVHHAWFVGGCLGEFWSFIKCELLPRSQWTLVLSESLKGIVAGFLIVNRPDDLLLSPVLVDFRFAYIALDIR